MTTSTFDLNSVPNPNRKKAKRVGKDLADAFRRRQEDTGWGRAFAHWIPLYGFYYAYSRRTITPWLFYMAASLASITLSIMIAPDVIPSNSQRDLRRALMFLSTPLVVKPGMNKAREYAKRKLARLT